MSKVTVTEKKPFAKDSDKLERKCSMILRRGTLEIQRTTVMEIISNAFDTGHLASSVSWSKTGPLSFTVFTNVDYAGYVHDGTERMAARPFFKWATDKHFPTIERALLLVGVGSAG